MLWRAFTQMLLLPVTAFAAGAQLLGRTFGAFGQVAGQGFDALVSGMVQAAAAPARRAPAPPPACPTPAAAEPGELPPPAPGLLEGEEAKLVRYVLLSVERERERILASGEEVVCEALSDAAFTAWILGLESRRLGLEDGEHRYLRVHWRRLAAYERPPLRHEERQIAALEGIRDALREAPEEAVTLVEIVPAEGVQEESPAGAPASIEPAAHEAAGGPGDSGPAPVT